MIERFCRSLQEAMCPCAMPVACTYSALKGEEWPTCSLILCQATVSAESRTGVKLLLRHPSLHAPGRAAAPSGKLHLWQQPHLVHANSMPRISRLIALARVTMPLTVISLPAYRFRAFPHLLSLHRLTKCMALSP